MTLRERIDDGMEGIRQSMMHMGELVQEMIRLACDAAFQSNPSAAQQVVQMDDRIDELEHNVLHQVTVATMRMNPVARDLQFLAATFGVLGEIEQAGDDAVKLARRITKLAEFFPGELKKDLQALGEETRQAFAKALKLYMEFSPELAEEIIAFDQTIDNHFKRIRHTLVELIQSNPEHARDYIRCIDAFHSLEHAADHAVEIAKRMRQHFAPQNHRGPEDELGSVRFPA